MLSSIGTPLDKLLSFLPSCLLFLTAGRLIAEPTLYTVLGFAIAATLWTIERILAKLEVKQDDYDEQIKTLKSDLEKRIDTLQTAIAFKQLGRS